MGSEPTPRQAKAEIVRAETTSEEAGVQRGETSTLWREAEVQRVFVSEEHREELLGSCAFSFLRASFSKAQLGQVTVCSFQ